jgi:hypothetical protein
MSISRGFEASYNVVSKALKGRAERQLQERLAQEQAKYGITENQAYTPEQIQGAQAETDAMARRDAQEFGLSAPMKYRAAAAPRATPGQVQAAQSETAAMAQRDAQEFGLGAPMQYRSAARGFLVGDKAFDTRDEAEAAANVLRTRGMADVYRQAGEVDKADELEVRARQRQAADLQLAGLKRSEAQQVGLDQANKELADARANGVELTSDYLRDLANRTGAKFDTLLNQAAAEFGFEEKQGARTVKRLQANLTKAAGGGVDGLNTFLSENFDPDKTDKILPKVVKDKQGNFVVMYGDRVIPSYGAHKSLDYLVGTVQGMIENDPLSALKSIASIRLTEAQIAAANRPKPGTPSLSQKIADAEKALGRTLTAEEKSIMAGLSNRPGLGGDRAVAVKDAGERVLVDGRLMITDGEGGYVAPDGVVPADRTAFLQEAGVPDNLIAQLPWSTDGRTVGFGGKQYNPRDPRDIRELNDDYRRLGANTIAVEEAQRNTPAQQAQRVGLQSPTAPVLSIPAGGGRPVMQGINARQY